MPNWQPLAVFCLSFAAAVSFKFILPDADHGAPDEADARMSRLKRFRVAHGACLHCGADLSDGRFTGMLVSSTCPRCDPDRVG